MNKILKGNRTRLFNGILGIPLILEMVGQVANSTALQGIIPQQFLPIYGLGLTIGNILLRQITTTPPGQKF